MKAKAVILSLALVVPMAASAGEEEKTLFEVPTPLFQMTAECVQWASGDWPWPARGGWKECTGHKYSTIFKWVGAKLRTNWPDSVDQAIQAAMAAAVAYCGKVAYEVAVAAIALAPEAASKTAASAVAIPAFFGCIESKKAAEAAIAGALATAGAEIVTYDLWK